MDFLSLAVMYPIVSLIATLLGSLGVGKEGNSIEKTVFKVIGLDVDINIYRVLSTTGALNEKAILFPILNMMLIGLLLKLSNWKGNTKKR